MKKELENNIRELSEIFARNVNILRDAPLADLTDEVQDKLIEGTERAVVLEMALRAELNASEDSNFYAELIEFTKKEGSDATKAMEDVLPFFDAFMENLSDMGVSSGSCPTVDATEEALDKTRKQFDAPSGP
ncbi:MAG: hypothetical protein CMH27_03370 [Micavibrio sp.]|nr:hypothetical protein [Micavibrio sp.]|tara:strand:+ start:458 stop:853 length:396 start_codon:yes stop_codon:yes gene_type:complete